MRLIICLLLCLSVSGCTINYVRDSSCVKIDARKDIKVTDPTTTVGLPVL